MKITPPKGRPMIYWVGKKPIEDIKGYPVEFVEAYDPYKSSKFHKIPKYEDLEKDWHNLLFEGDNKEVLATLLELGFRGKIDLIYIDPPFASNKDYVRKVELRGLKGLGKVEEDEAPLLQQVMYEDIWKRDEYFQWIYERLLLMKELLSEKGSIYVHLDWHVGHYVKVIFDEVFGEENFKNEIVVKRIYKNLQYQFKDIKSLPQGHDVIYFYSKNPETKFKPILVKKAKVSHPEGYWKDFWSGADRPTMRFEILGIKPTSGQWKWSKDRAMRALENYKTYLTLHAPKGKSLYQYWLENGMEQEFIRKSPTGKIEHWVPPSEYKFIDTIWSDIPAYSFTQGFGTEKSEPLAERIIKASTKDPKEASENGENIPIVLDCFIGSGTTAAVAQKLGRRWIGVDINKGAVQLTAKRVRKIIKEQLEKREQSEENNKKYFTFAICKVNDYDLKLFQSEAKELAIQHLGIERMKTDPFFDGKLGNRLVKIIDFNHPLTLLDLEALKKELEQRPKEERDIVIVCYGKELNVDPWLKDWNKKAPLKDARLNERLNRVQVIDLRIDKEKGGLIIYEPPKAEIEIKRIDKNKGKATIRDFVSPTVLKRFNLEGPLLKKTITDFRSMIDYLLIDPEYDEQVFRAVIQDIPHKKEDLVKGEYEFSLDEHETKVAIKIVDVLGNELIVCEKI